MSELDELRGVFLAECDELILQLESAINDLAADLGDIDAVHAAFRATHSLKGGAGAFGYDVMQRFAHGFESALGQVRDGERTADDTLVHFFLRGCDYLAALIAEAQGGEAVDPAFTEELESELALHLGTPPEVEENIDDMVARLLSEAGEDDFILPNEETPDGEPDGDEPIETAAAKRDVGAGAAKTRLVEIRFAPGEDFFRRGNDPRWLLAALDALGDLEIIPDLSRLPALAELDAKKNYLAFHLKLTTDATREDIAAIFGFLGEGDRLDIADPMAAIEQPKAVAHPTELGAQPTEPRAAKPAAAAVQPTLRVEIGRVDRLVDMVGELAITQSVLVRQAERLPRRDWASLIGAIEELTHLTRDLQESVMAIRTQPVRAVFQKMPRLARDLAAKTGKDFRLITEGEETEVDKTVVEQLSDPLTHLIRNAVDHGLETPDERAISGKAPEGLVRLAASHRSGRIVIELSDDGRGINPEKVFRKARDKGLVSDDDAMSDEDKINLIFAPGFSTAESVSDLSGRGVGLDVVRRNIADLGGRVSVRSQIGQGSRFTLTLPLTLAVVEAIACEVGARTFLIPITSVVESFALDRADLREVLHLGEVLLKRGETFELVWLRRAFGIEGAAPARPIVVLVEDDEGARFGIVVDQLIGQFQVVVKSLERHYRRVRGVAAATILGDGGVAMILDVAGLAQERLRGARHVEGEPAL